MKMAIGCCPGVLVVQLDFIFFIIIVLQISSFLQTVRKTGDLLHFCDSML